MLAYLDQLCAALLARNQEEIRRLLKHPLARALPRRVREEAAAIARAGPHSLRAPIQTLRFYHQTAQLLATRGDVARRDALAVPTVPTVPADPAAHTQTELPRRAAGGSR